MSPNDKVWNWNKKKRAPSAHPKSPRDYWMDPALLPTPPTTPAAVVRSVKPLTKRERRRELELRQKYPTLADEVYAEEAARLARLPEAIAARRAKEADVALVALSTAEVIFREGELPHQLSTWLESKFEDIDALAVRLLEELAELRDTAHDDAYAKLARRR